MFAAHTGNRLEGASIGLLLRLAVCTAGGSLPIDAHKL